MTIEGNQMQQYVSKTRIIEAKEMTRYEYANLQGWDIPKEYNPDDKGYLVVNPAVSERNLEGFDGYVSWLPEQAFKEQYDNSEGMTFSQALELLKSGGRVYNADWPSSRDGFLVLIKGAAVEEAINDTYGDPDRLKYDGTGQPIGVTTKIFDSIYICYPDDTMSPWVPDCVDILSNKWFEL